MLVLEGESALVSLMGFYGQILVDLWEIVIMLPHSIQMSVHKIRMVVVTVLPSAV